MEKGKLQLKIKKSARAQPSNKLKLGALLRGRWAFSERGEVKKSARGKSKKKKRTLSKRGTGEPSKKPELQASTLIAGASAALSRWKGWGTPPRERKSALGTMLGEESLLADKKRALLRRRKKGLKKRKHAPDPGEQAAQETGVAVVSAPVAVVDSGPVALVSEPFFTPAQSLLLARDLVSPKPALHASIEGFLLDQRSEHTRTSYGKDLKRFIKYLLMREMDLGTPVSIDRSTIIGYKEMLLAEGLEHTTVDRHLACLRSFFRWLKEDGHIEKNPAEGVRFMSPRRLSTTQGFTDDEVCKVLEMPDLHTRTGCMHYAVLMVLFYCGLRRSEVCDLRLTNLSEERGHTVLRLMGKGNKERLIPLLPPVRNAIELYFRAVQRSFEWNRDEPIFFPVRNNRTGELHKPLDPSLLFYIVRKYAKQAAINKRVSPHSCRATAISNARDHHVPDRAIQEFAGWSSPTMITHYDKRRTSVENSAALAIVYEKSEDESS